MKNITILLKPASSLCNLRCKYCFYEDVAENRQNKSMGIMTEETAEIIIEKALRAAEAGGTVSFMFQGGEPTVAGPDFFKGFIELEKKHAVTGVAIEHSIQTNGMAIDREWAEFLRENDFLVGLSLDGTEFIHDKFRVDLHGNGTWQKAVKALQLLDECGVETNILCVVTKQAAKKPQEVYRSLRSLGAHPLQFIACLDPLGDEHRSSPYSLSPEAYGRFLCLVFDCWYADWKRGSYVTVRGFEDYLRHLLRMPPTSCSAAGSCGHYLVIEADGSLYPCDFYVLDSRRLGNIRDMEVDKALTCDTALKFIDEGAKRPQECYSCRWAPLCRGGCKRDFTNASNNRFCAAYKAFFPYAIGRLEEMAAWFVR